MNLDRCTDAQRSVVTTLDAPLMVSAGAGSGKTFTLTQRVAFALAPGEGAPYLRSVDELLAITFTDKAAAELKSRIKGLLLEEGLADEALKVDGAWVSTIHGMASRILREHALELGVDPAFEVISEAEARDLRAQAAEQVLGEAEREGDPLIGELLAVERLGFDDASGAAAGRTVADWADALLSRVYAMPDGLAALDIAANVAGPAALIRAACDHATAMLEASAAWVKPAKTKLAFIEKLQEALDAALAWLDAHDGAGFGDAAFDREAFAAVFYGFPLSTGSNTGKDKPDFDWWQEAMVDLEEEMRAGLALRWLRALVALACRIDAAFAALKGPSRLDNNDLLRRCSQGLREHPAIAEGLRRTFKIIMVDEFQDTDRMQVDIIGRLSAPDFANVCTVGDAQQSIYRFRGADVNVFTEYRAQLRERHGDDGLVSLDWNFRSHGDILAFVERIFGHEAVFGSDFLRLAAHGAVNGQADPLFDGAVGEGPAHPRVTVSMVQAPARGEMAEDPVAVAAETVAAHFADLAAGGAAPGDMVLLLGRMANAHRYADALRARGLAAVIAGGSVFASMPEPRLVSALLRWAVNGLDDAALYAVLASPLFALADDVLLTLASRQKREGGIGRRSMAHGFTDGPFAEHCALLGLGEGDIAAAEDARALLFRFRDEARRGRAAHGLRRLFAASGALDRWQDEGACGIARAANVAKAVRIVEDLAPRCTGLASLVAAFDAHLATAKEAPGALAASDGDFVRIMTVHASKGLEFPHVAVADLKDGKERGDALVVENIGRTTFAAAVRDAGDFSKMRDAYKRYGKAVDREEDERLLALDGPALADALEGLSAGRRFRILDAYRQEQAMAEARRLLYVALTRASRSLFVSLQARTAAGKEYDGIAGDLFRAAPWEASGHRTTALVDYGGTAPARVEYRFLGADGDAEEGTEEAPEAPAGVGNVAAEAEPAGDEAAAPFVVPVREPFAPPRMYAHGFVREGLWSYTSLSGAHGADGATAEDEGEEAAPPAAPATVGDAAEGGIGDPAAPAMAPGVFEDATALGTAFHRLAQQAIERSGEGRLWTPPEEAVAAQIQKERLTAGQQERLRAALDRWLGSPEAARFAAHGHRGAEVPFIVAIGDFYLEGEIDGLADNGDGAAFLIDYKTGGTADETAEALDAKHRLQASCYAYALMRAGYASVDAHFLRIEHESADDPRDPQIVAYHFDADDVPSLESLIRAKQKEASS